MVSFGINLKSRSFSKASSINTFDFSTLYTILPHDKLKTSLKETIHKAFSHRNDGSTFVVAMYLSLYGVFWNLGIQYKLGKSSDSLPEGMFKEVMKDLWLPRISSLSNEAGLYDYARRRIKREVDQDPELESLSD
jgi:hypothetical protein